MASHILHIKDSYYFEVPRGLWRKDYQNPQEFYDAYGPWVVRNDSDYQDWAAEQLVGELKGIVSPSGQLDGLITQWKQWQHQRHARAGRPLEQYLVDELQSLETAAEKWANVHAPDSTDALAGFMEAPENAGHPLAWMAKVVGGQESKAQWQSILENYQNGQMVQRYLEQSSVHWAPEKLASYNQSLSGKIFIPQPFATLRNPYEVQSGFGISRYMLVEVVVALIMLLLFRWLAGKVASGAAPRGKLWNLLEATVLFVRNKVVVPAMGEHDADKYMPLFWTLFFFVLGCNLMGMIPWVGAPTSVIAVTGALALVVFGVGAVQGVRAFGFLGYLKNLAPSLGLPLYLAIFIVPLVYGIEALSLVIKHLVLAVRLLANMVAGHLVLLGFVGIGFGAHAVSMNSGMWGLSAVIAVVSATLLSFLELFVACLQAYIFTFLAALFVGSATHHH